LQRRQESNKVDEEFLVVSNPSVIIAFAKIRRLYLLEKLFEEKSSSQKQFGKK